MFNIIIATHGSLSKGLLEAAEFIVGKQSNINTFSLNLGDDIEEFCDKLQNEIKKFESNQELLVLTDLQSGSPFNAVVGAMQNDNLRHFTGVNMPMLLTALCERSTNTLGQVCEHLLKISKESIIDVNELLKELLTNIDEEDE